MSNPPILAMSPVRTSLKILDEVGMPALRARSLRLTGYLRSLLETIADSARLTIVTPDEDERHGAQLSVRVPVDADDLITALDEKWGVVADDRRPDIIRLAPVPLYCTFHDCWRAVDAMSHELTGRGIG
jgi:kynureninase